MTVAVQTHTLTLTTKTAILMASTTDFHIEGDHETPDKHKNSVDKNQCH